MKIEANSVEAYMAQLPNERAEAIQKLRNVIKKYLPKGFEEVIQYGMIGYVVPLSAYSKGYLSDSKQPLPYIGLASQKNFIGFYHMGFVAGSHLLEWFRNEYAKSCKTKLDMGKSCVRLKKTDQIPYELIGQSVSQITVNEWIALYEKSRT